VAYPDLVEWSVTFWGPKGVIVGRCDPKSDSEVGQGMKNAQKLKCSESDETNTIASGSSSRFRWYIYFVKQTPYAKVITF
jgi:hypothetical protein